MKKRRYGWRPQPKDFRDISYKSIRPKLAVPALPDAVDLTQISPVVFDQGDLGSCTANAIVAAYEADCRSAIPANPNGCPELSRLFLYYNERAMEGTIDYDAGANIRDGIKSIAKAGICREELHPYDISTFRDFPTVTAYNDALNHQAIEYAAVDNKTYDICAAIADGHFVVFGFTVYTSFESEWKEHGVMPIPKHYERTVGGHAVCAVGYDMAKQMFLVKNSWGEDWGIKGYFWMPFVCMQNLSSDHWVIKRVE